MSFARGPPGGCPVRNRNMLARVSWILPRCRGRWSPSQGSLPGVPLLSIQRRSAAAAPVDSVIRGHAALFEPDGSRAGRFEF